MQFPDVKSLASKPWSKHPVRKEVNLREIMFSSGVSRQYPENKLITSALCPENQNIRTHLQRFRNLLQWDNFPPPPPPHQYYNPSVLWKTTKTDVKTKKGFQFKPLFETNSNM